MSSSSAAVAASFPASLSDLQLSTLIGDQQKDLHLTMSSTSPPFLLVVGDNTQHIIFSCFHSCIPLLRDKGTRWRSSRFHKDKQEFCPPIPGLQDICSCLIIEMSGCCQVPYLFAENGRFGTEILGFLIDLLSVSGPGGCFGTKVAPILDRTI
jgi:hypothetical protein